MKLFLKPMQWLYCIYALIMFAALTFLVFPFVAVSLLFGKIKGGNFIYKVCTVWGYAWYFLVGIRHRNIYEAPHDSSRQYIFVANHISYMDIPPAIMSFNQPVRVLAKFEMTKVPVFGFIYKHVCILVDRTTPQKRAQSVAEMKDYLKQHVSIFLFPEGTFNETGNPLKEFYDGAFKIAIETQTPIKPVLFVDTLERLHYSSIFNLTPGRNRTIFLEEISVTEMTSQTMPALKQTVYDAMDAGLRRYRKF